MHFLKCTCPVLGGHYTYDSAALKKLFDVQGWRVQNAYHATGLSAMTVCRIKSIIEECCTPEIYTEAQVEGVLHYLMQFTNYTESDYDFVKSMLAGLVEKNREIPKPLLLLLLNHLDYSFLLKNLDNTLTVETLPQAESLLNASILHGCFSNDHVYDETIFQDAGTEIALFCSFARLKRENYVLANILIPLFIQSCLDFCDDLHAKSVAQITAVCAGIEPIPQKIYTTSLCCLCANAPLNKRLQMVIKVVKAVLAKHPDKTAPLVITTVASGACYTEALILSMLLKIGYKNITLACVDIAYETYSTYDDSNNENITEVENTFKKLSDFAHIQIETHSSTDAPFVVRKNLAPSLAMGCDAHVVVALFPFNEEYSNAINGGFPPSRICISIDPTKMASCVMNHLMQDDLIIPVGAENISLMFAEINHCIKKPKGSRK